MNRASLRVSCRTPGFEIRHVWYLSVGSIVFQMCVNLLLLRHELRKRLKFDKPENFIPASATASLFTCSQLCVRTRAREELKRNQDDEHGDAKPGKPIAGSGVKRFLARDIYFSSD
jgi:hypothetical protein